MDKRAARSGRKAALIAGLGALAVLGSAGLSWRSLAVQYHLFRLNREPEYFHQLLKKTQEPLEGQALLQFLSTSRGLETLARTVLKKASDLDERIGEARASGHSVLPLYDPGDARTVTPGPTARFPTRSSVRAAGVKASPPDRVKVRLLRLLSTSRQREFTLPEHSGLRFWVSVENAIEMKGICVISRDEGSLARAQ